MKKTLTIFLFGMCLLNLAQSQEITIGIVHDSIHCKSSPEQTYSIFLPKSYNSNSPHPIIYIFEPAARGSLPVKMYHKIAENYGFILVSSNNSKNGPIHLSEASYKAMRMDTEERFSLDPDGIYTCGFSGGGRVAQFLASMDEDIDGIIAVAGAKSHRSASFPPTNDDIIYIGIVGTSDMNYREHRRYQSELESKGITSELILYDGGHRWPPESEFGKVLEWIHEMRKKQNGESNDAYITKRIHKIDSITIEDRFEGYRQLNMLDINFGNEITAQKVEEMVAAKALKKSRKADIKDLEFEDKRQQMISEALQNTKVVFFNPALVDSANSQLTWWKQEIANLKRMAKREDKKGFLSRRLIDHLRGNLYVIQQEALGMNRLDFAIFISELQLEMYENSIWYLWNHAILLATSGNQNESEEYLDKAKAIDQQTLDAIRSDPRYSSLKSKFPGLFD